jgi:alkyl sulfatase BDS1-like metallo-beta-lactamase superfamily hydrolase
MHYPMTIQKKLLFNIASIRIQAPKKSSNDAIINTVFNEHELYNHTVKMKAGRKTAVPQLEAKFTSNIEQLKANTSLGKKTEMHTVSTLPAKFMRKKDIRMCHLYL